MFVSAGVVKSTANGAIISGSGVMLNILLVAFLASILVKFTEKSFGHFKILLQPLFVAVIAGGIGLMTLQPISVLQTWIGDGIAHATELTPLVMGAALGVIFAFLIVSPLSSVGIAMAISLAGVGSGAANAGITVASFTLALMGASVNPIGGTLAHFVGSPKIQIIYTNKYWCGNNGGGSNYVEYQRDAIFRRIWIFWISRSVDCLVGIRQKSCIYIQHSAGICHTSCYYRHSFKMVIHD